MGCLIDEGYLMGLRGACGIIRRIGGILVRNWEGRLRGVRIQ